MVMTAFVSRIKPVIYFTEPEKLKNWGENTWQNFKLVK